MPLIKRYLNRKLYDTEAKQYVTLDQIAQLIQNGHDVQVIDHETGEDLTTLTLSQVILELERRQSGFLSRSLMTSLIRTGGDAIDHLLRSLQRTPSVNISGIEERIEQLVAAGTLTAEQARSVIYALQPEWLVDENVPRILQRLNASTRRDLDDLCEKLASLDAKLEKLAGETNENKGNPSATGG